MKKLLTSVLLATLLLVVLLGSVAALPHATVNENIKVVEVSTNQPVTADRNFGTYLWLSNTSGWAFESADVFYTVDEGTANAITLTLQVSPDGVTWINHATDSAILTNSTVDVTGYKAAVVDGRFFRLMADVANTNPVTVTLKAVLH